MLSEEKRKIEEIIKDIKIYIYDYINESIDENGYTQYEIGEEEQEFFNKINTVLDFMTKLQKEIEHQKEKRENQKTELAVLNEKQKDMNKLINTVKSYKGQFKRQEKQIRELQKENKELKLDNLEKARILEVFDDRKYRKKYLKERRKEEPNLLYPDGDEIYKRYYEQKKQIDLMAEKINEAYFEENNFYDWFEKIFGIIPKGNYKDKIKKHFEKTSKGE